MVGFMITTRTFLLALLFLYPIPGFAQEQKPDPRGVATDRDIAILRNGNLEVMIGNNTSHDHPGGKHRAGYNGVFAMTHSDEEESPFVPTVAGLNLEHYFDGRAEYASREVFFEPRYSAMSLRRINDTTVELHQPPTKVFGVESWTRFQLHDSGHLDFSFRCVPRKMEFTGGFFGVFWASYLNAPIDKSLYFLDGASSLEQPVWRQFCTQLHNRDSTVLHQKTDYSLPFQKTGETLFTGISPLRYSEPFFYGRFRNMVLIYLFQPNPHLRFTHSPSGGGRTPARDDSNPAWDFQLIVPQPVVDREYQLKGRLIYKVWKGRADVLEEARKYLGSA